MTYSLSPAGRLWHFSRIWPRRFIGNVRPVVRPHGAALSPEATWGERTGACRDLAPLFNEVCRLVGLPARFVSGYGYSDFLDERHLHAWSEVYLPGAGWRGFDPTIGLAVADRHIAVAAARDPEDTAPTSGTYRGTGLLRHLRPKSNCNLLISHRNRKLSHDRRAKFMVNLWPSLSIEPL